MPWIVYFIAGGGTFVPGAGLLAVAVVIRAISVRRWLRVASTTTAIVGIALVAISAEAISWWIYWIWIAGTLIWLLRGNFKSRRLKWAIDLGELAITFAAAAFAFSFRFRPSLPREAYPRLDVIGDSISAGIGAEHGSTWPGILAAEHRVHIVNLARAGATIADASRRLKSEPLNDGLVLLEVGGNDMIGRASPTCRFEKRMFAHSSTMFYTSARRAGCNARRDPSIGDRSAPDGADDLGSGGRLFAESAIVI